MADAIAISHTDIEAFLRCRRLFGWSYVEDFRVPEVEWGPLPLGSRVHGALEALYRHGTDPRAEHERLAHADLASAASRSPASWQMDRLYEDIIEGRNCCEAFVEWLEDTGADDGLEVTAVEEQVETIICDGRVRLRGKVDVRYERRSDGAIVLNDWKTAAAHRSGLRERLERSYQHHVYLGIERLLHPDQHVAGAYYTVIKKVRDRSRATTPLVERFSVPASERLAVVKLRQVEEICGEMLRMMERMADLGSQVVGFPTPEESCRWCDYRHPCELQDENVLAARSMLDDLYIRGGRHARYGPVVES